MKPAKKSFDPRIIIAAAKESRVKAVDLRKAIKRAEDLGLKAVVQELQAYLDGIASEVRKAKRLAASSAPSAPSV
ncbi:MAG: hypothetical protein ACREUW_06870 [Burkholderiales bacterium]